MVRLPDPRHDPSYNLKRFFLCDRKYSDLPLYTVGNHRNHLYPDYDLYEIQEGEDSVKIATIKSSVKYKVAFAGMIKNKVPENLIEESNTYYETDDQDILRAREQFNKLVEKYDEKIKEEKDRIHELRTTLNLTLEKFGKRLGVTKVAISNIEKGNRNVTDQMRKSICREYGVNEIWLTSGTGKMFISDEIKEIEIFEKYFKTLGFSIEYNVTKWHYENPDEPNPSEKIQIVDDAEYIISKGGKSVNFTPKDFDELQSRAKETIEGIFYKKLAESEK